MSTHSIDQVWSLPKDVLVRFERGAGLRARPLALVDEAVAIRRCALYRSAFRAAAVSYPAALLGFDALTMWIRRHGVTVDVTTALELDRALAAGIAPTRIVMKPAGGTAEPIRFAADAEVARFVVTSRGQIATLAERAGRKHQVVVDATDEAVGVLASDVLVSRGLELIGLHCRLNPDDGIGALALRGAIAEMSWIRRRQGVLLSRISVAGIDVGNHCEPRILRSVAGAIDEVIGDACARHGYPRPALTVAPGRSALLPT